MGATDRDAGSLYPQDMSPESLTARPVAARAGHGEGYLRTPDKVKAHGPQSQTDEALNPGSVPHQLWGAG